jgi:hypothetical protein
MRVTPAAEEANIIDDIRVDHHPIATVKLIHVVAYRDDGP